MDKKDKREPLDPELMNEPGSIGEEQNPQGVEKTDKHVWNYASDKNRGDDFFGGLVKKFFGRGGEH